MHIYSDIIFGIYRAFYLWCENFIKFGQAVAEILQHPDAQQSRYGKLKFRESLSPDDMAKSHLEHGTIVAV